MKVFHILLAALVVISSTCVVASDFTMSTYNCGGLSSYYDYFRAAGMQKLMRDRYLAEPEQMALNEKIQKIALKKLFAENAEEKAKAQEEWDQKGYQELFEQITLSPHKKNSPNEFWNQRSEEIITTYQIRPVVIYDAEVYDMLSEHVKNTTRNSESDIFTNMTENISIMARNIFLREMKHDIICLQETNNIDSSLFPEEYEVVISEGENGIAWNTNRFKALKVIGNIKGRASVVELLDKETKRTVLVASCHLTGCNPYVMEWNPETKSYDSAKGDQELQAVLELFKTHKADIKLIGMDSNVTAMHPRLHLLKDAGFRLDSENYLEGTCTNPHTILDTRIDWIGIHATEEWSIVNVPVQGVGLNNLQTNMSDHKPVAAKIVFKRP